MAVLNGDRFTQQQAPRPGLYAQHSNSVPSTPYQKPRDLSRRYSKSPSPRRNLGNQSPRSVVSETVENVNGAHRSAAAVCKFETGDEIRKRRMPYVDGGDQELGPPKKEPRNTLQPDEQDKLSGDMRELYDRLLPSPESEERRAKLLAKLDRILNEEWPGNDIRVNVFGSSGNLLSSTDSDVDICITTQKLKSLERMHPLAALLHKHGMQRVVCRAAAKVPIVKAWDPELSLASDLNVNNPLALQNTRLIKTYVQVDDRVRPLAKIIKHWTKQRILNDAAFGATISSYTWMCMVISFLQRREPPILPSLQKIPGCRLKTDDSEPSPFADDLEALKGYGKENKETVGELLFQFFRHYGYEFEFSKYVVSVREGRLVTRKEKGWDPANAFTDKQANNRLCVEEPFTSVRNLGNTADDYAWHGIHLEIRRAFEMLDNGLQLEKCCEEYEFPKEEKPIFQKPPPKPKPTLTRSASQSGQSTREPGSNGRSRKNNRNQSAQRPGNRRASSGASFGNQRLPFSPLANSMDYFQLKGSLHEQLYQQYQLLQAQQDALRSQLVQQQAQAQSRVGDLAGASPRPRPYLNGLSTSGLSSPRLSDHPPQTAPLLSGYFYNYPTRYPPPSPMSQARSRDGTNTNPSSPSLVAAVPALRRQPQRQSIASDGSASSVRSQSQPGRSLPHPVNMHHHAQLGFDFTGAPISQHSGQRSSSQIYHPGQPGIHLPFSPLGSAHPSSTSLDSAMPKEYVGYYVGQSPQLGPLQYASQGHVVPPMTLRDPPTRQRRITPDLMPPTVNGKHGSRSPSPLGHLRSFSSAADHGASQPTIIHSPPMLDIAGPAVLPAATQPLGDVDIGGPLIVNGSNRSTAPKPTERASGNTSQGLQIQTDLSSRVAPPRSEENIRPPTMSVRTDFGEKSQDQAANVDRRPSSPHLSPLSKPLPDRRVSALSPNGLPHIVNGGNNTYSESTPLTAGPLLSPVAELRTPSPTQTRFDANSPKANGHVAKAVNIVNAKQTLQRGNEGVEFLEIGVRHERKGSTPVTGSGPSTQPPRTASLQTPNQNQNSWQQVPKKGHKKSKSFANGSGGQALPANESERKGG